MQVNSEKGDDPLSSFWKISFLCIILKFRHNFVCLVFSHQVYVLSHILSTECSCLSKRAARNDTWLLEALLRVNHSLHLQSYEPRAPSTEALHPSPLCPLALQSPHQAEGPEVLHQSFSAGQSLVTYTLRKQESGWIILEGVHKRPLLS